MSEPRWLTVQQILAIHDRLISDHGGLAGVRNTGLLESALMRPRNTFAYGSSSLFDLAAAYAHGIAKNHPFHDGNKRAALMSAYTFLGRNGYQLNAIEENAVITVQMLASGELDQAGFAAWLKRESIPR